MTAINTNNFNHGNQSNIQIRRERQPTLMRRQLQEGDGGEQG